MYKCIFATLAMAVAVTAAQPALAARFSSLEERMSQSEFHAAGLDKLSPDELKALNTWLRTHYAGGSAPSYVTPSGTPVFYPQESGRETVESRIDGQFSGWRGKTVFTLENGQKWVQAESGSFSNGKYDHPKVKIKPMVLGSWLMYVEPCGCSVRVQRTQ